VTWAALFAVIYPLLQTGEAPSGTVKAAPPGVRYRMNIASATSSPWVDSNLWRYRRDERAKFACDVRQKSIVLAMAEAFSVQASISLQTEASQKADYDTMLAFLQSLPPGPVTRWAQVSITADDGSFQAGEVLNMLTRKNILFSRGNVPQTLPIAIDSKISNAYEKMQEIREKLGDDHRVLRIFGSELTLAELAREGQRVRLHLVNYGSRPVETIRIRIQGKYTEKNMKAYVYGVNASRLFDFVQEGDFTEFSLDRLPVYGVLDFN